MLRPIVSEKAIWKQESIPVGCVPPAFVVPGVYPTPDTLPPEGTWDQRYPTPRKDKDIGPGTRKGPGTRDTLDIPPVNRMTDTNLWKHYLPATTVEEGNNHTSWAGSLVSMPFSINALKSPCLFWCCTTNGYMITVHLDPGVVWPRRRITTDCWWIRQNSLVTYKQDILCFPSNCRK